MKAILRRIAAFYLLCASTSAFASSLSVGYDEAWFKDNYLDWLADNPSFNQPSQFDSVFVEKMFTGMVNGNAKIVRIWVFPGLQGIQLNAQQQTVGLTSEFSRNLPMVLSLAKSKGLKVQLVALNGVDMQRAVGTPLQAYFRNLLLNISGERDRFKTNVLLSLFKLLNPYQDVIYGLDLINEIEAPLNSGYFSTWLGAREFIQDMTAFVKSNSSLRVTSSAGFGFAAFEIAAGLFSGVGLDFYDLHAYADWGLYPLILVCNRVSADGVFIILGEYGQTSQTTDDNLQFWTTANFLFAAKAACFSAGLAWMYQTTTIGPWFTYLKSDLITFRPAYNFIRSFH